LPDTVEDYLKKWLETAAKPRLRENTYKEYEGLIQRYIKPKLGAMRLSDLRPLDVQKFYASLTEKKLSPRTVRFTHSVLTSAFKQAVRWRMLAHNPCNSVELPRKAATEMQSLTPLEAAKFLREASSDRWSALFVLALATGLRPSEYLGLKWSDIDLEQGVINVQRERLGHASITLTMDTYSHVLPDMQQGASDKLEQMLFAKTGTY
jgi:integrase